MRFKPSALAEDLNGSIGGITAAKNTACSYFKLKPIPTNPNTQAQKEVRARFKTVSLAYKALTEDEKKTWDISAKTKTGRSVFGIKAAISGINLFQRVNNTLASIGAPVIKTPASVPAEFPSLNFEFVDGCVLAENEIGETGSTSGMPALVFNKFTLPENIVMIIRMSSMPTPQFKFNKSLTKIVTMSPKLIQLPKSDEKNKMGKDLTIIPVGQEWTDIYHLRPKSVSCMISIDLICKTDGSQINVLTYCGTPEPHVLGIQIDKEGNVTARS